MNKFFDVMNIGHKNAKSWFIIAKDREHAKKIASTKPGTPKRVYELDSNQDNIPVLIQSGKTGILAKEIRALSLNEVFGISPEPNQPKNPWFFTEEIK